MRASERSTLVLGALLSFACSGAAFEAPGEGRETISGGALDSTHRAVYREFTHWPADDAVSSCTATLIAPNLLLTARHCISSSDRERVQCGRAELGPPVSGQSVAVSNSAVLDASSVFHRGADVRVPSEGNDTCGFDVALVILEDPIASSEAVPAIPRIDRNAAQGEPYVAIGYGQDETGAQTPGRMLRSGLTVACGVGTCANFGVAPTEFLGEAGVCSGDSGGPALDADGKVVGVVSRGADPCETPVYGSVASWAEWIMATAIDAAASGGYDPPFWALSGSSDPPEAALGEGEACTGGNACEPGLACYYALDPSDARCTATCSEAVACSNGKQCSLGFAVEGGGLCLDRTPDTGDAAAASAADEGCAVAFSPGRAAHGSLAWLTLGLVALVGARRRRR